MDTSTYNEQDHLTELVIRVNGTVTETRIYEYDAAGNAITSTVNSELAQVNTFDKRSQLMTTSMVGIQLQNIYNGEGLRVSKCSNGELERYQLDGTHILLCVK